MGKINNKSEVEIIPVSESKAHSNPAHHHNIIKMHRMPYMSDPSIVPRVQKYLESNVDKTYVDINLMSDDLQRKYREYAKRKRSAFRASVKKAYSIVLHSYGLDNRGSSSELDDSDESTSETGGRFHDNSMNDQLVDLYTRPQVPKRIDENELIDISSDDSEEPPVSQNKTNNGSVPAQRDALLHPAYNNSGPRCNIPEKLQTEPLLLNDRGKKRKIENVIMPYKKPLKKKKSLATLQEPSITFKNIGGINHVLEEICKLLIHIRHPELFKQIGITPPRGFLLHGPPGCGKTLLANAIAGELGTPLLKVAAPELVAGVSGESEQRIRELFERALLSTPCILFIDEIDAITPNRQNAQKEMERRIVAQLLSCMDDLNVNENGHKVLVIGATNRPDSLDPALRRAGRFDREICLGIPNVESRKEILKVVTKTLKLSDDFDYESLAKYTPGFVGADLVSLTREAAMVAVNRLFYEIKEKRKLEEAIKLQKQKEKKAAEEISKEIESNKSDPEIIIDDDASKDTPSAVSKTLNSGDADSPVVVLDDDVKQTSEAESIVPLPQDQSSDIVIDSQEEVMTVDLVKPQTELEELVSWLHDEAPLTPGQLESLYITGDDFAEALKHVQPSAKREGFATVPDVTWDDVGSLRDIREELQMTILAPVRHSEQLKTLGLTVPTGVLLCGPPGCGKTLLAKAIANEAGINFISVKGPELLNMYVGESERAVRVCFERARNSAPCVIFFDELDALCPKRSDSREGGAAMRVVNQMLTEMDGVEERKGVFILGASNRPDIIDPAVLRPGRLDKIIYVGLPTATDRVDILRAITRNGTQPLLSPDVSLEAIGNSEQCQGYTGADLAALVREAGMEALKEFMVGRELEKPLIVTTEHFKKAVLKIRPSVSEKDQKHYEKLKKMFTAVSEQSDVEEMEYS